MSANYATYSELFNSLYTGTALTDLRMSDNVEIVRRYLVDNGAGTIAQHLGIGIRVFEREALLLEKETIKREFVFISGPGKGRALTVDEIRSIGLFLPGGPFFAAHKEV